MPEPIDFLFSTPEMAAAFSAAAHMQGMLAFEAALARSEARAGIIPTEAAATIAAHCRIEAFDIETLYREAAVAGTPAIPLVRMLTAQITGEAQKYVHWGATSQDAIDTAMMLQIRHGLDLLDAGLMDICSASAQLAERHRHTLMVGRTLLQPALPITFGLKAARWLSLALRQLRSLRALRADTLAVQLGGAAGTLASLGKQGLQVVALLAEELELPNPDLPWHTERDRVARIATTLGIIAGAMAKIAEDLVLMAQGEVGEVAEGKAPGKGGSSAMPHKHNPVDATAALAAARLALGEVPVLLTLMVQEHERAVGGWQAEWVALPDLFRYAAGAVARVGAALAGLQVDAARMQENFASTGGLIMSESLTMALAPHVGRPEAQRIVNATCEHAIRSGIPLQQAALAEPRVRTVLTAAAIEQALDPAAYIGSTEALIDRSLNAYQEELQGSRGNS
ncbi:3-carboxy-cis,cis-muconate cycloisomerase [Dictyobacter formicarum]|uniref:3-carboxy-cis,cis-muconate cycloisomerase n=1 Tax=Dictyobacter formicarum TaxID=2778368 RepID=A0ABQ3VK70_9CHLR|nr:3-carboxy-cis,cis-muconate cycloisomerase [Dictyobacter formicarum]GHO86079.1 3-carboxy-cis,cis-muconate cycloisomerase [Dictyobacter formicarum]